MRIAPAPPTVIMVAGVNGVGKTTSIAKLANLFIKQGKKVMLAAGDTFRAAATEQLDIWSKRIGADIVKHQAGADPAAVTFDALEASLSRGIDILIVDTAGRLHTHENLMKELSKIKRVISKKLRMHLMKYYWFWMPQRDKTPFHRLNYLNVQLILREYFWQNLTALLKAALFWVCAKR